MHSDRQPGLLELRSYLAPALENVPAPEGWWSGPRTWWRGPLDVEGLALGSVGALVSALAALDSAQGDAASRSRAATSSALVAASFDSIRHLRVDGNPADIWAPMSGFRRTRDGWVRLHANYPHHAERLLAALGIASADQLDAALLERDALEVEDAVRSGGGVAAAVRTPDEWAATSMGIAAAGEPWIRLALDEAPSPRLVPHDGVGGLPLSGIRVLDLTRVIAGPSATRLLGALGADVLRVDPPQHPELLDAHLDTGFAKRSAVADLRNPEQAARVRALAGQADVVLLGYRRESLARYGLDIDSLREAFPHLAVVALSAWGWAGPWADGRGFDSIVQAACGIAHLYAGFPAGTVASSTIPPGPVPSGPPTREGTWRPGALPVQALDHATGVAMAASAVALLAARSCGVTGSARLSLIATANELLRAGSSHPSGGPAALAVETRQADSAYGRLDFVPPPLILDGTQLEYPHPSERYGSAPLGWSHRG